MHVVHFHVIILSPKYAVHKHVHEIEKVMDSVSKLLEMKPYPKSPPPQVITSHDVHSRTLNFLLRQEVPTAFSLEVPEGKFSCARWTHGSGTSTMALLDSGTQDQEQLIGETDVRDIPLDQLAGLVSLHPRQFPLDRTILRT